MTDKNEVTARIDYHMAELQKALAEWTKDKGQWTATVTASGANLRQD